MQKSLYRTFALITCGLLLGACQTIRGRQYAVLDSQAIPAHDEPSPRGMHTALWTGDGMLIWGGMRENPSAEPATGGAIYFPKTQRWGLLPEVDQDSRYHHSAVWTGNTMIVWGGTEESSGERVATGWVLDLAAQSWHQTSTDGAPTEREGHTAIWTGQEMIVWGGVNDTNSLADGGLYEPQTDVWEPLTSDGAPEARSYHTAIWTGSQMIVWGGLGANGPLNSGGVFDPETNSWRLMSTVGAPSPRFSHSVVWTGKQMIVWGGRGPDDLYLSDGAAYDPATDTWTPLAAVNAPSPRELHTAVWTGQEMVIWGGHDDNGALANGAAYSPETNTWRKLKTDSLSAARTMHSAVWTGNAMLLFGGRTSSENYVKQEKGLELLLDD